jgi:type IV secretion system protein VirB5
MSIGSDKLLSEYQEEANNPYLNAKWEWNERYISFIKQIKLWRNMSIGLLISLIIAIVGLVILSLQSKISAYYIKTDQLGKPIVIEKIDETTNLNSAVVAYQLGEFILQARTVTTDGKLKKMWMQRIHRYCSDNAWGTIQSFWAKNPPDKIAEVMNISVVIDSVLPIKETESWQISWTETATKQGETIGNTKWSAILNIGIMQVTNEQEFVLNPTGLIVKSINWSMIK